MNAFKVGDRVRVASIGIYRENPQQGIVVGNTGTVTEVHAHVVGVRTDNATQPRPPGDSGWAFYPQWIEPIADSETQGGAA